MIPHAKLFVGPVTLNTIKSVCEFESEYKILLGLTSSRRQIDYNKGYVNNFNTQKYYSYVKKLNKKIILERDHGGPNQNKYNYLKSLKVDSNLMSIIHIDVWKKYKKIDDAAIKTAQIIKKIYNNKINFEVGTEERIRQYSEKEFVTFLHTIKKLLDEKFSSVIYAVVQGGAEIIENRNTEIYNRNKLENMINICKEFGLKSKEHNNDYLSPAIIKEKYKIGLDSINIAPEFGNIETSTILTYYKNKDFKNQLYYLCKKSNKWKAWVGPDFNPDTNKMKIIQITGHYILSNPIYRKILIGENNEIDEKIKKNIKLKIKNILL